MAEACQDAERTSSLVFLENAGSSNSSEEPLMARPSLMSFDQFKRYISFKKKLQELKAQVEENPELPFAGLVANIDNKMNEMIQDVEDFAAVQNSTPLETINKELRELKFELEFQRCIVHLCQVAIFKAQLVKSESELKISTLERDLERIEIKAKIICDE